MELKDDEASFRGLVARPDGSGMMTVARSGAASDATAIATEAGKVLAADMDDSYRP